MMTGGGKSNAIKDLLRSMLHAWYDLTKEETGTWTAQLETEVALQQGMRSPVNSWFGCLCDVVVVVEFMAELNSLVAAYLYRASSVRPARPKYPNSNVFHARYQHSLP